MRGSCEQPTVDSLPRAKAGADHGRIETLTATVSTDIGWLQKEHHWPALAAIAKAVRMRDNAGKTTTDTAHFLLSTARSGERLNEVARLHWGVEDRPHWRLDVVMNEDQDGNRLGNAPHNLALLRHMALNILQKDTSRDSTRVSSSAQDGTTPT